jgi:chromosome segregation ATPase
MTPDVIATWIQNKALTDNGRRQLEQIAAKKREISANEASLSRATSDLSELEQDQRRTRDNIQSLNNVSGQQELVQQYARQLAQIEIKMAGLRDTQSRLKTAKTQLEGDLSAMMEKTDF